MKKSIAFFYIMVVVAILLLFANGFYCRSLSKKLLQLEQSLYGSRPICSLNEIQLGKLYELNGEKYILQEWERYTNERVFLKFAPFKTLEEKIK